MADNAKIIHDSTISKNKPVILRALRKIEPGEEIMVSYGADYWCVYRGLDKETAARAQECYELPTIPPHRPDINMNMTQITENINEEILQVIDQHGVEESKDSGTTSGTLPTGPIYVNGIGWQTGNNLVNSTTNRTHDPTEENEDDMEEEINHETPEDPENDPVSYTTMDGTNVEKYIHTKHSKDLPRSRVDSTYHSIADKSKPTLDYRGVFITKQHDIRIATLNVNGLNSQKLSEILWWIQMTEIDVFIGIDTRVTENECRRYHHQCHQTLGATTAVRSAPIPDLDDKVKPQQKQNVRVGGQIVIINKKWGPHHTSFWKDNTGYGVVTTTTLVAKNQSIQIVGTYWPFLVYSKTTVEANPLWSKVERWMQQHKEKGSPLTFIQHLIACKTNKHIYNGDKSTGNISILAGDLNSNFKHKGKGGCHKGTVVWAEENGWLNRSHDLAAHLTPALSTHCSTYGSDS